MNDLASFFRYKKRYYVKNNNGDKMNENNELLMYIYKNADMGIKSTTKLIRLLNTSDNKIKKVVEGELKGYEEFLKRSKAMLKKNKVTPKGISVIADISSGIALDMEFMKDNSDSKIADMLIRGFTMGNIEIDKKIEKYKGDADKNILKLAKELKRFGEINIELLQPYL